jgi:hypothetical protein
MRGLSALLIAGWLLALPTCSKDEHAPRIAAAGTAGRTFSTDGGAGGVSGAATAASGGTSGVPSGGAAGLALTAGGGGAPTQSGTGGTEAGMGGQGLEANAGASGHWQPHAGLTWQWQLSEPVTDILDVDVYDIDWESDAASVEALHTKGVRVVCYVSVGSWEDFRSDADSFPPSVIGNDYDGWPGEKYLDIRSDAVKARMLARFDVCRAKGFDAIEPDNMDVFEIGSDSGFPLTHADGVSYAEWLADAAHGLGLGIGQKNASSITADIASIYDWALTESCYSDGDWCGDVKTYPAHDKPVFMCEYEASSFSAACAAWKTQGYSPILKDLELGAAVTFCP